MKTLHYVLTREWFDKIYSDDKTEEYRAITAHNVSLLFNWKESGLTRDKFVEACENEETLIWGYLKHDSDAIIIFSHGYSTDRDQFKMEWLDINIGEGKEEWGAKPGVKYFIHTLGNFI